MNRQYSNMGVALMKAAPWVIAEENNDNDVFWGLLEHSKEISNEQMQDLIAKIIAGEYNQPGTYSMSTLQVIKSLGKSELEKFEKNCTVLINNLHFLYNFYSFGEPQSEMRVALGINYKDFVECQNLGLVQTNAISQNIDLKKDEIIKMVYFDKPILLKTKGDVKNYTLLNIYQLTNAGQQILQHLSPMPSDLFYNWAKKHIAGSHFEII